jgi:hypothetical protein
LTLTEEKDSAGKPTGVVYARGVFGKADEPTGNNRIYPRRIYEREIAALQKQIEEHGGVVGELDHPADGKTQLKRVSHVITKLEFNPQSGEVIGEARILDTDAGRTLKEIVKSGVATGVSSRGNGSVVINEHGQEVVQEDFHLVTFDFVAEPASASAYPSFVMEEKNRREAEMADEKMTVDDLKEKYPDLVKSIEDEARKAAEEAFAKRVQEIRAEERNMAKDELREAFKKEILDALAEQRAEIEKQVRSEVMSDPKVAKAQKALETLKTVLRPIITDEDISAVVKEKDDELAKEKEKAAQAEREKEAALAEVVSLREQIKKLQEQTDEVGNVAREMGYKLFLERAFAGMTDEEKDLAKSFIGDLRQIKGKEDLQAKVEAAKEKVKKLLADRGIDAHKVKKTVADIETEVVKLENENKTLQAQVAKLTEGLEKSLRVAKDLGLRAYAEKKLADHPRRFEIRKVIESKSPSSKEEIDQIIKTLTEERRTSDEFRRLRESLARGKGRTLEDETKSREDKELLGVPVSEMRRLAGVDR